MEVKRILWPTDFSANANRAQPYVTDQAAKYGAEVVLLYVVQDLADRPSWYGELTTEHAAKLQEWEMEQAKKKMEEVCQTSLNNCPAYRKKLAMGDPATEILKAIETEKIDLVVMSNHGRGREKREAKETYLMAGLGSVSLKVIEASPVPVIAINTWGRQQERRSA